MRSTDSWETAQQLTSIRTHDRMAYEDNVNTVDWVNYSAPMQKSLYLEAAHDRHFLLTLIDNAQATVERNTAPEEKWLDINRYLSSASYAVLDANKLENLSMAIRKLYLLLEPPSVRERRLNDGG